MATIKQLEAQLATASTARQRAEIAQGIAFLRKQAAEKSAANAEESAYRKSAREYARRGFVDENGFQ